MHRAQEEPRLLPHEAAFFAFFIVTWLRLGDHAGWLAPGTLLYAGLAALVPLVASVARAAAQRWSGPWPGRLRLFACFLLMDFVFRDLRRSVPLIHPGHVDALLQALDRLLIGISLPQWFDGRAGPVATELLSLCYCLFFFYLLFAVLFWVFAPPAQARAFYAGLFSLYAIGFAGYTMLPAIGPYATMHFETETHGFIVTRLLLAAVPYGTNRADAFPSLHCAVTAFILGFDLLTGQRRRARWCAAPVVALWLSTIVLRFHYAVDDIAGFVLALLSLGLAAALLRRRAIRIARSIQPGIVLDRRPTAVALTGLGSDLRRHSWQARKEHEYDAGDRTFRSTRATCRLVRRQGRGSGTAVACGLRRANGRRHYHGRIPGSSACGTVWKYTIGRVASRARAGRAWPESRSDPKGTSGARESARWDEGERVQST